MKLTSNRGFTLIEMVVTVAVMAILIGLSAPAIYEFMRQRDHQTEEIAQIEIRKAMQAYLAETGVLPDDTVTSGANAWFNLFAGYTSLSANDIQNDVWGRPRMYVARPQSRNVYGIQYPVYYATVHSMGLDGNASNSFLNSNGTDTSIPGIAVQSGGGRTSFAGSTNNSWWKNTGSTDDEKVNAFSGLRPGGDDVMTRFTNYAEVLDRYNTTLMRLDKVSAALETYARSGYAERVSLCSTSARTAALCDNGVPEYTVYYPRSSNDPNATNSSGTAGTGSVYGTTAWNVNISNSTADATRRTGMIELMNELGLPAEFCCSALTTGTDNLPKPFYYFSNPRPRATSTTCGTRPTRQQTHLPARLTTENPTASCG